MMLSAAVYMIDITTLKLLFSVENSTGYGIFTVNILNSYVSHSRFIFNNYYTLSSKKCSYGLGSCQGDKMYLFLESEISVTGNTLLSIDACVFSDGVAVSDEVRRLSGGLTISYEKSLAQYDVEISVLISNVVSTWNVGMHRTISSLKR